MESIDEVKVPKDRIGAVIGKEGKTKREIEKLTDTKLEIISDSGTVKINRTKSKDQAVSILTRDVIKAIAVGFTPKKALKLLIDNYFLQQIDVKEHIPETQLKRIKARVIGTQGKARKMISEMTNTDIVIYKNNLSIIGTAENGDTAYNAIMMLVQGASHKTVFKFLRRNLS